MDPLGRSLAFAEQFTQWDGAGDAQKILLADAQTSGGLLLCVAPRRLEAVMKILRRYRTPCAVVIGQIVRPTKPLIRVTSDGGAR